MITTVLFDMGGTLEDIWFDEASKQKATQRVWEMLNQWGMHPSMEYNSFYTSVQEGWKRYGAERDKTDIEQKPWDIWCKYVLADLHLPEEQLIPHCEELAHMWELTHFYRIPRPRIQEMLSGLKSLNLKLGIISNTASLYQVFSTLDDYNIRDYFQDVTLSSVTGLRKPCKDIFQVALHQVRSAPSEAVYVGDTISRDVVGPKKAGFGYTIRIGSKLSAIKDVDMDPSIQPDYTIEDIYDVYPILKKLVAPDT